jgi:desulfoferrodoxin-like iron-binding protein
MSVVALVIAPSIAITNLVTDQPEQKVEMTKTIMKIDENSDGKPKASDTLIINRQKMIFADAQNPTEFELEHTPEINFGEAKGDSVDVFLKIGSKGIVHPNQTDHWVDFVKIIVKGENNEELVEYKYTNNGNTEFGPYHIKSIKKGDKVTAEIGCNLHGIWENSIIYE